MSDRGTAGPSATTRLGDQDETQRSDDQGDEENPNPAKKSKRLGTKHVSQACDACKARKVKCDGARPNCATCPKKKLKCTYGKKDGRKNRGVVLDVRDRIDQPVGLLHTTGHGIATPPTPRTPDVPFFDTSPLILNTQIGQMDNPNAMSTRHDSSSPITVRKDFHVATNTANTAMADPDFISDTFTVGLATASAGAMPTTAISIPQTTTEDTQQGGSPFATSQGSHVSQAEGRLKRPEGGSLMQLGPTSLWSYARETHQTPLSTSNDQVDQRPGDYIHWAQHLPPDLPITKAVHDAAIATFGAYYAPWCRVVDMPAFTRDMDACNLVTRLPRSIPPPTRTAAYSPLLHNCVLYLGLHLLRSNWPDIAQAMENVMDKHFAGMVIGETENPNPSTLRAFILFATCMNVRKEMSARDTGYIYFGMAFAAVQALGVNLNCDHLLISGQITDDERDLRNNAYWTFYQQDLLRAIAVGRPPMLSNQSDVVLPRINPATDAMPWSSNAYGKTSIANGLPGMVSTVFHWSARLHCILRTVMLNPPYSVMPQGSITENQVITLAPMLECWYRDQPFSQPALHPLPHALIMHMLYHVTNIYLFRPYYRSHLDINPSPSHRCDQAASMTVELLRVYEAQHGVRNSSATLIPIIFATATVQLLRIVSSSTEPSVYASQLQVLDEIVWFMDQLTATWIEARRGLEVIHTLRAEWLPGQGNPGPTMQNHLPVPTLDQLEELPKELHEWLQGTTFWEIFNNDNQEPSVMSDIPP